MGLMDNREPTCIHSSQRQPQPMGACATCSKTDVYKLWLKESRDKFLADFKDDCLDIMEDRKSSTSARINAGIYVMLHKIYYEKG